MGTGWVGGQSLDEYTLQASRLIERSQLREAEALLRQGLDKYPQSPELSLRLGGLLLFLGRSAEGDEFLGRALEMDPHNQEALRKSAEAKLRLGRVDQAMELFRKALWHGSNDAESHYRLAFALFLQGEEDEALDHARRAVEINPFSAENRRFYSLLLGVSRRREDSYQQLLMAFRLQPDHAPTLYLLGQKAIAKGNFGQALEFATLAVERDPENPLYPRQLAEVQRRLGSDREAELWLARAEALQQVQDAYAEAVGLKFRGYPEKAAEKLEAALKEAPPFPTGLLYLADLYRGMGRRDEALAAYLRVLELDPRQTHAREEGAWIQAGQGSLASAIELLRNSDAPSPNAALLEGYQAMLDRDWELALRRFEGVLAENPLTPGLLDLMARCLAESGRPTEALGSLSKAKEFEPGNPELDAEMRRIRFDEAVAAQDRGEWRAALQIYEKLIAEDATAAAYRLNAAYCRQRLGDLEGAIADYREGLRLDSAADWARVNLASCLYRLSRFQPSLDEWRRVAAGSDSADSHFQSGLCLSHLGRDAEAEVAFEKAMKRGLRSREILYNLGVTKLRLRKLPEAWALIRRSASLGYPPAADLARRARSARPRP